MQSAPFSCFVSSSLAIPDCFSLPCTFVSNLGSYSGLVHTDIIMHPGWSNHKWTAETHSRSHVVLWTRSAFIHPFGVTHIYYASLPLHLLPDRNVLQIKFFIDWSANKTSKFMIDKMTKMFNCCYYSTTFIFKRGPTNNDIPHILDLGTFSKVWFRVKNCTALRSNQYCVGNTIFN